MNAKALDTTATVHRISVLQPEAADVDLRSLAHVLWRGKLAIFASTMLASAAAFGISEVIPKKYKATVLISPVVRDERQSGLIGRLGQLGGLAGISGLTDFAAASRAEAIATLQSEVLTEKYIREHDLLPVLYADKWDAAKKAWMEPDPRKIPTVWGANLYFSKAIRAVTENRRNNLVTMTITWKDPVAAAKWANDLVALTNDYMRQIAIDQADANMEYLNQQASKTSDVGIRQSIYDLMEVELKNAMIAKGDHNFALKIIDPAVPPERPSFPSHFTWALGGLAGGLLCSIWYVVSRPPRVRRG
jgi:uncharacterized protein involved in exopolysaccharide biosynthesis